jgi:glycosyltransferase involved in cell wall biosynthesis
MHFVFISSMSSAPWGGSEELWSQTALRLRQEGHKVSVCVAWWPQLSDRVMELERNGANIYTRKNTRQNIPVRLWKKVKGRLVVEERKEFQWLRVQQPDLVVISQGGTSDGLEWMSFCVAAGMPFVSIVQCNNEAWYPGDDLGVEMAAAYRAAKKVCCVSQHNLRLLECQIGEKLPNGVVVWNTYNVPPDQPPDWPDEKGTLKLACVARLEPAAKGQDLLFQVLALKRWQERPLEINLYGSGNSAGNLKKLAASLHLKNVHFRGHVKSVKSIWAANHLLVLPSRFEGLPLALVEAMWCARPGVVTDVGGNAELCVDGQTGFVAPAPSVKLFDHTLERAWNQRHEWRDMGICARARAEKFVPKDPVGNLSHQLTVLAEAEPN